jgi:D-alanyl-D-alanine carboxypeptidase (penicillin-binding protein 5/6)
VHLIEWALNSFTNVQLAEKGKKITDVPVAMGKIGNVALLLNEDVKVTIPKSAENNFSVTIQYKDPLIAPVEAGQEVGKLIFNIPDMEPFSYPLVAENEVEKVGFLKKTWIKIKYSLLGSY